MLLSFWNVLQYGFGDMAKCCVVSDVKYHSFIKLLY